MINYSERGVVKVRDAVARLSRLKVPL